MCVCVCVKVRSLYAAVAPLHPEHLINAVPSRYLGSFGEDDVAALVRERPHVLGEGIESVCKVILARCSPPSFACIASPPKGTVCADDEAHVPHLTRLRHVTCPSSSYSYAACRGARSRACCEVTRSTIASSSRRHMQLRASQLRGFWMMATCQSSRLTTPFAPGIHSPDVCW